MALVSPLEGRPKTVPLRNEPGYRVVARYLTPVQAKLIDFVVVIAGLAAGGWIIVAVIEHSLTAGEGLIITIFGWLLPWSVLQHFGAFYSLGRLFVGSTQTLEFTPDEIRIKGLLRFKKYSRRLPHEFDCSIHEKASDEEENEQQEQKRAKKYYRKSFHVTMRYAGQRVDIASVFGKRDAEALLARLQLLDRTDLVVSPNADLPKTNPHGPRPDPG